MKEKYLELLNKKYLNLGISKELLTLWADNLATGTDENADEAALQRVIHDIPLLVEYSILLLDGLILITSDP